MKIIFYCSLLLLFIRCKESSISDIVERIHTETLHNIDKELKEIYQQIQTKTQEESGYPTRITLEDLKALFSAIDMQKYTAEKEFSIELQDKDPCPDYLNISKYDASTIEISITYGEFINEDSGCAESAEINRFIIKNNTLFLEEVYIVG